MSVDEVDKGARISAQCLLQHPVSMWCNITSLFDKFDQPLLRENKNQFCHYIRRKTKDKKKKASQPWPVTIGQTFKKWHILFFSLYTYCSRILRILSDNYFWHGSEAVMCTFDKAHDSLDKELTSSKMWCYLVFGNSLLKKQNCVHIIESISILLNKVINL